MAAVFAIQDLKSYLGEITNKAFRYVSLWSHGMHLKQVSENDVFVSLINVNFKIAVI